MILVEKNGNLCNRVAGFRSAEGNFNFEVAGNNWNHPRITKFSRDFNNNVKDEIDALIRPPYFVLVMHGTFGTTIGVIFS